MYKFVQNYFNQILIGKIFLSLDSETTASSANPLDLTNPDKLKTVFFPLYLPSSSTFKIINYIFFIKFLLIQY